MSRTRNMLLALFALAPVVAYGQNATYGDWKVQRLDETSLASTTNDSGGELGKLCIPADNNCMWVIFSGTTTCKHGQKTPALVNAAGGAYNFTLSCISHNGAFYQVVQEPDLMDYISDRDPTVSFAIPMIGDTFRVLRFSLNGSDKAVAAALQAAIQMRNASTRDISL